MNELLRGAMNMLRRGQRAVERQEWETGETTQEWYFAAGQLAHAIEIELNSEELKSKEEPRS